MNMRGRGRPIALLGFALAALVAIAVVWTGRHRLQELWYLRGLESDVAAKRLAAARRLIAIRSLEGIGEIIETFREEPGFSELFSEITEAYGSRARAGIPALAAMLDHPDAAVRFRALQSLACPELRSEESARALAKALRHPAAQEQIAAARVLADFGRLSRPAVPELVEVLPVPHVGAIARDVLLDLGGPRLLARSFARLLDSEASETRLFALDGLRGLGDDAEAELVPIARSLSDEVTEVGLGALVTLEALDIDPALIARHVVPALSTNEVEIRRFSASVLGEAPGEALRALGALEGAAADPDDTVRAHAIRAIGNLGPRASQCVETLIEQLGSFGLRKPYAADALGRIGPPAVPPLVDALKTPAAAAAVPALADLVRRGRGWGRWPPIVALMACGESAEAAIPDLVEVLGETDWSLSRRGGEALARIGEAAVGPLIEVAQKADSSSRAAIYALGVLGPKARDAIPVLIDSLDGEDPRIRAEAAMALGRLGAPGRAAVPALVRAAKRGERAAIKALGELGDHATSAAPDLLEVLEASDPRSTWPRIAAARAIWRIGGPLEPSVSTLSEVITTAESSSCRRALGVVEEMGPAAAGTVDALSSALRRDDRSVLSAAAKALDRLGHLAAPAVPALIDALREPAVREHVLRALGSIGAEAVAAAPYLTPLLMERSWTSRQAAIALGRMGPAARDAVPALVATLGWTGRYGAEALGSMGPAAAAARPALRETITRSEKHLETSRPRPAWSVVAAAAAALWRIGPPNDEWIRVIVRELKNRNRPAPSIDQQTGKVSDRFPRCETVARILGELGPAARLAVPVLEDVLETRGDPELRLAAAVALYRITGAPERVVPALVELLEPRYAFLRGAPARALGDMGSDAVAAVPALVAVLGRNHTASTHYRRYGHRGARPEDERP